MAKTSNRQTVRNMTEGGKRLLIPGGERVYHGAASTVLGLRTNRRDGTTQNAALQELGFDLFFLFFGCYFAGRAQGLFRETDAQRFQEGQVLLGERSTVLRLDRSLRLLRLFSYFVEADRSFQHEQNIEALLSNVFNNASDIFRLRNGFVDRFAKFLNEVFDLLIQCHLRVALCVQSNRASGIPGPTKPAGTALRALRPYLNFRIRSGRNDRNEFGTPIVGFL